MLKLTKIFFVIVQLVLSSTVLFSQDDADKSAEMKAWKDYMTPGPMHEMMAQLTGNWKTNYKFWMDPSAEPMLTEGTSTIEMILGGRHQMSKSNSSVMGMPMEGIWILGFDNITNEFTAIWIDNMGTGTAIAKGKYDESTETITMYGNMIDPFSKKDMKFKQSLKMIDSDHFNVDMKLDVNGQELNSMEIEFIRQ